MTKKQNNRKMLKLIRKEIERRRGPSGGMRRDFLTKLCGISEATMDRVINDRTGVRGELPASDVTLKRVAEKLGLEWVDE